MEGVLSLASHVVDDCSCLRSLVITSALPELPSLPPRDAASCRWSIENQSWAKFPEKTRWSRSINVYRGASKAASGCVKRRGDSSMNRNIFAMLYSPPVYLRCICSPHRYTKPATFLWGEGGVVHGLCMPRTCLHHKLLIAEKPGRDMRQFLPDQAYTALQQVLSAVACSARASRVVACYLDCSAKGSYKSDRV